MMLVVDFTIMCVLFRSRYPDIVMIKISTGFQIYFSFFVVSHNTQLISKQLDVSKRLSNVTSILYIP